MAYSLDKKNERIKDFSIGFLPHVVVFGAFAVCIIKQPDFGTVIILAALTWLMMFIGGVRCLHLIASLVVIFLPMAFYLLKSSPYRMSRILGFLNPWQ